MLTKLLTTSSNLSILSTLNNSIKRSSVKIFKIANINDVIVLWRVLQKYLQSISTGVYEQCLFTPALGVTPYISRIHRMPFFTHQVFTMVKRHSISSPSSFEMLIQDSMVWIEKFLRYGFLEKTNKEFNIYFAIYYDKETLWRSLLYYIPVIVTVNFNDVLSIIKCKEVYVTQFTRYSSFRKVIEASSKVNIYIITPNLQNNNDEEICNPLTCINPGISSPYSFDNEIEFIQRFSHNIFRETNKLYIEFWSSIAYLDNDLCDYIWFFNPTNKDINEALKMLSQRSSKPKIVKVIITQDLIAELGAINSRRIWLSPILKNIIMQFKSKVILM